MPPSKLSIVRLTPLPVEPESVALRTDYRVGQVTYNALDRAIRQADIVSGEVLKVVTRESRSVVYRAKGRG